jgi:predicted HNH restriction endonuclease
MKEFTLAKAASNKMAVAAVLEELEKCICVCENCHRKIHGGLITLIPGL